MKAIASFLVSLAMAPLPSVKARTCLILLGIVANIKPASADTFVPPTILTTTWSTAGGRYIVSATATVPIGQVLTVEPGVEVILAPGVTLDVRGKIIAVGTQESRIRFHGAGVDPIPSANFWTKLYISENGQGQSVIQWCEFSDAVNAISLYNNNMTTNLDTEICDSTFRNCSDSAIRVGSFSSASNRPAGISPIIQNCLIKDTFSHGISFFTSNNASHGNPIIENNIIHGVAGTGIHLDSFNTAALSSPIVRNNVIFEADEGIFIDSPFEIDARNNIISNCANAGIRRTGGANDNLQVRFNCFHGNGTNFSSYPAAYGTIVWTNANGDPADINFNIFVDPGFVNAAGPAPHDFKLVSTSPCIDAGDPTSNQNDLISPPSQGTVVNDIGAYGGPAVSHVDIDEDGMWDDWEINEFGDLSHDGTADGDIDGLTDREEFRFRTNPKVADSDGDNIDDGAEKYSGTDPNDSEDRPAAQLTIYPAVELVYVGEAGTTYQLQRSQPNTLQGWFDYGAPFNGSPGPNSVLLSTRGEPSSFFRVREVSPP